MRKIEKQKKITKPRLAIILGSVLLLAVTAVIVLYFTVWNKPQETPEAEKPIPMEGEAVENGYLIAYPTMETTDIQYISVENDKGSFGMVRPDKDGNFTLFYEDADGNVREFRPNICDVDDDFTYTSLYAIEKDDGYGTVPKLTYLCMALQLPYVEERIELNPEEMDAQLDAYGLAEGEYETVRFTYLDEDGNEKSHTIQIGDPTVIGTGYYLRVDGRNCVYASFQNQFDYALAGFYSFVNPIVISPGISEDTAIGAYLTTNYYQWLNEMHKNAGDIVEQGSRVIAYADVIVPVSRSETEIFADGYMKEGYSLIEFDLSKYKDKAEYARMLNALTGKAVGDYSENEIVFTLTNNGYELDFSNAEKAVYEYTVLEIEAVLTDNAEISAVGAEVGENNLVKLAYTLKINGASASANVLHAVVDLSEPALPESFVMALRNSSVGKLPAESPVSLTLEYTKENSEKHNIKYVITEIVSIFDSKGVEISKVTESSIVTYRYRFMIDGVYEDKEYLSTLNLGSDSDSGIKEILKGKSVSTGLELIADEYTQYCEYFSDFISYSVARIDFFVTKEMVSAFRFLNKSDRDPFYGESIYENTMENKYVVYGLNNTVCQRVVNILTGISEDTTSAPNGLIGTETVEIGLTPEVMQKYGLYAHTIYFELPRGIFSVDSGYDDVIDDYDWYEILGFTLYISDEQEDGTRYVASDLYDLVAKMDAENFVFLKYDFVNFFARRDLMLTDVGYIDQATFELCFEDMKGLYQMELTHTDVYIGSDNYRYEKEELVPDGVNVQSVFDEITVKVTPEGECTPNKLTQYIANIDNGSGFVSLTELYNKHSGSSLPQYAGYDPLGTSNFKKLLENIYFTRYEGVIPPEEQGKIVEESTMLFRMSFKLSSSAWRYVYEFYRYDDSRVMVRLYQATYDPQSNTYTQKTTPVADFYISNFGFQKIVNNFVSLLNLEIIDKEAGYID